MHPIVLEHNNYVARAASVIHCRKSAKAFGKVWPTSVWPV
jgi:hypothetical protein